MAGGGIKQSNISIRGGADGATFIPSVSDDGTLSWTNNKGYNNPTAVNIKGMRGEKGEKGEKGDKGDTPDTTEIENAIGDVENEIRDARRGKDDVEYSSLGEAIRSQAGSGGAENALVKPETAPTQNVFVGLDTGNNQKIIAPSSVAFIISDQGVLQPLEASTDSIKGFYATTILTPSNQGLAVKYGLISTSEGTPPVWTDDEKAIARETLGIDKIIGDIDTALDTILNKIAESVGD